MKGLFIKDLRILFAQKRFFIVVIAMGAFLMFSNENVGSVSGYIIMLMSMLTLTTISYDDYDNGMAFIMTLPIQRKQYVQEKYLLGTGISVLAFIVTVVIAVGISECRHLPYDIGAIAAVGGVMVYLSWLFLAVTLPFQIKYGAEKGRIAMLLTLGVVFGTVLLVAKLITKNNKTIIHTQRFMTENGTFLLGIAVFALILVLLVSYFVSVRIINKKEY